ncbi:MAG TPA: DNA polymerase III subunit delta [Burkholderiaceae bacterium]|jgi:DNA polymerase-3 subunit delta|nr:DNA polymerase III subunit delta [Burkholderiaceae bacterium]
MQIKAEQLRVHLAKGRLARLYVVAGDEALLAIEAQDAIRAAARGAGFAERTVLHADARFDWSLLEQAARSQSLFSERRMIDVRLPSGKPGKDGAEALTRYAASASEDTLTLLGLPKLERTARESAWARALEAGGVWVDVPAVDRDMLPEWIAGRLERQRQSAPADALKFVADRVEGNLLAAHQEISKLALLFPAGTLTFEQIKDSVLNVARYDVFALPQAMLEGDRSRIGRTIEGLRAEGEALPLALWVVSDELRTLLRLKYETAAGRPFASAARELRVWGARLAATERALARVSPSVLTRLLARCAQLDRIAKGLPAPRSDSDPWLELADIALSATTQ